MDKKDVYVTINHLKIFKGEVYLRIGDILTIRKDRMNPYDDEAMAVYDEERDLKIGYVANSVSTVARGTYSSGRLYDLTDEECKAEVCFMLDERIIAKIL
ncbi:MAG: HIRAN domain-containing protein [Erysipelotrichaceae bacterium]|nr:HIRAN domain-containing protein [Erysipelotrichaceae bacterium]